MKKLLNDYIDYLKFEKRYSVHTTIAYRKDLAQFINYYESYSEQPNWESVDNKDIRSWIAQLIELGNTAKTANRKLSSLKSFYLFLNKKEIYSDNPAKLVSSPKIKKSLPQFLEQKQINQLIDELDFGDDFEGRRNHLIVALFYFTGIRLSELINLKEQNLDLAQSKIKVLGKRNKERIIPLHNEAIDLIKRYLIIRTEQNKDSTYLFFTSKHKKLYPKLVYQVVNQSIAQVSTLSQKSPHVLRHTFATQMLNNGAELNAIKELLGHENLTATQIYTHNSFEKLRNTYKQAHPRE